MNPALKNSSRLLRIVALAHLLFFSGLSSALACKCATKTPEQYFAKADIVVIGKIVSQSNELYEVEVVKSFKGSTSENFTIAKSVNEDCGLDFKTSKQYLLFIKRKRTAFTTTRCSGNEIWSHSSRAARWINTNQKVD